MARYQVKVKYGEERFSTFLLENENVSYKGLLLSIRTNCSSLAHLDEESIRIRYKDEDGDLVNIAKGDNFAFAEMLRTAKEVKDRDVKKIFLQAHEVDSPVPVSRKRKLDLTTPSSSNESAGLQPRQLAFRTPTLAPSEVPTTDEFSPPDSRRSTSFQSRQSPLDSKQQELNENLMVLRIQVSTAKEELEKLNQQDKNLMSLSTIRARLCNICHGTGHTKTTCKKSPCLDVNACKVRDKHPEHKAKIQTLQREIKTLEKQFADEEANVKSLISARERAKTSFFAVMRPRLRSQNLMKYATGKRIQLDRDLLLLQRALNNRIPEWSENEDWKLPQIIEQYQNSQLKSLMPLDYKL